MFCKAWRFLSIGTTRSYLPSYSNKFVCTASHLSMHSFYESTTANNSIERSYSWKTVFIAMLTSRMVHAKHSIKFSIQHPNDDAFRSAFSVVRMCCKTSLHHFSARADILLSRLQMLYVCLCSSGSGSSGV